jgi:hypothetical protein
MKKKDREKREKKRSLNRIDRTNQGLVSTVSHLPSCRGRGLSGSRTEMAVKREFVITCEKRGNIQETGIDTNVRREMQRN